MNKLKMYAYGLLSSAGAVLGLACAHAAVDPDVTSNTLYIATSIKDNVFASVSAALPTIVAVGVFVLMIFFIWRLAKRFMGGGK